MSWTSPISGAPLVRDTEHSLSDGAGERWPVIDGIAYLRSGRGWLVNEALDRLDHGHRQSALVALLADQDPWFKGPAPDPLDLVALIEKRDELSLREAMALLRFGPVADYFAHRWSDPTFLAGLALLEAHRGEARTAFELAAGIGQYARELGRVGLECVCCDIVFAKCWLAKHWIAPDAQYVVFDARDRWPIGARQFDLVHCQDAFYFFSEQPAVAERLRRATASDGVLAVGHLHNAAVKGGAFGPARTAREWRDLFPAARVYDERALRAALLESEVPEEGKWSRSSAIEAWSVVEGGGPPARLDGGMAVPHTAARLMPNPLIGEDGPAWPSSRYEAEYGRAASWIDPAPGSAPERDRRMLDLPERW
ncbi:MAG: methyltransferase domain-containing protein [Erythrobacter sp.]|uniref:class I SAM-dependent methyltransferase n=1 Tax=Erythrobacter sp. TaxID=1042 RepID=UPI003C7815DE